MPDPCNECGSCCFNVRGVDKLWRENGWLNEDGSCKFYDPWFKRCTIYKDRPDVCRMEKTCPPHMSLEEWYSYMSGICDDAHQIVFGCPREHNEPCSHYHPVLEIQVETSVVCNARCHFCPYKDPVNDGRRGKFMDPDLFYKIADEVAEIPKIRQFAFNGLGEPLLDPHIYDYISYVLQKRPEIHTLLHTNGVHLDPQRLRDTGLTQLVVSLNAVNAKQHEEVMGAERSVRAGVRQHREGASHSWLECKRASGLQPGSFHRRGCGRVPETMGYPVGCGLHYVLRDELDCSQPYPDVAG